MTPTFTQTVQALSVMEDHASRSKIQIVERMSMLGEEKTLIQNRLWEIENELNELQDKLATEDAKLIEIAAAKSLLRRHMRNGTLPQTASEPALSAIPRMATSTLTPTPAEEPPVEAELFTWFKRRGRTSPQWHLLAEEETRFWYAKCGAVISWSDASGRTLETRQHGRYPFESVTRDTGYSFVRSTYICKPCRRLLPK